MKVTLSILERLLILNLLPGENDIITLRLVRKLKDQIGFTDEELVTLNMRSEQEGNRSLTKWDQDKATDTEFELSEKVVDIIRDELKNLDKIKKLTENHISLYTKIVEAQ
jgi:hypothetical protein